MLDPEKLKVGDLVWHGVFNYVHGLRSYYHEKLSLFEVAEIDRNFVELIESSSTNLNQPDKPRERRFIFFSDIKRNLILESSETKAKKYWNLKVESTVTELEKRLSKVKEELL